ncbi:ATP-binding protein [Actinocatenispora comari]|uniref:AAA+ ATPase domain-containing protein n=1 Tax=Actinocatenispora comari TaxID=2807577 RepID=A0A8J4AGV9_9ACTN|nr:ATP-binding protein [Actinocatenispora comari]GIL30454.1 hypothetical protein NUM_57080 [Actinocatenispora comari]
MAREGTLPKIKSFDANGLLYENAEHHLNFGDHGPVSIIAGPNGVGKTHILRTIHGILGNRPESLLRTPFKEIVIELDTRKLIRAISSPDHTKRKVSLRGEGPRGRIYGELSIKPEGRPLPYYWQEIEDGVFLNTRTNEIIPEDYVEDFIRYDINTAVEPRGTRPRRRKTAPRPAWWREFGQLSSVFIDTKRLDTGLQNPDLRHPQRYHSRIDEYIDQVRIQVTEARRMSLAASQRADESFAARVFAGGRARTSSVLIEEYDELAEQNAELFKSGLSTASWDMELPSRELDTTERRVLSAFIEDWKKKITPLLPVHERLKTLQQIVNDKFIGKTLLLDSSGRLVFHSNLDGQPIPVNVLSSGEQHLLALFTMLLFSTSSGTVVLIDEPEISLHAAWKHSFISDITDVATICGLQIILATHSAGIINGRWDIVEELAVQW